MKGVSSQHAGNNAGKRGPERGPGRLPMQLHILTWTRSSSGRVSSTLAIRAVSAPRAICPHDYFPKLANHQKELERLQRQTCQSSFLKCLIQWIWGRFSVFKEHPGGCDQPGVCDNNSSLQPSTQGPRPPAQAAPASAAPNPWFVDTPGPLRPLSRHLPSQGPSLLLQQIPYPPLRHSPIPSSEKPS